MFPRLWAGFFVAGESLTKLAENLDLSAIDLSKFKYAGARGEGRTLEEARLVWESIPEQLRALGPEEVRKQLDGFDWSHIVPFSKGGGNEAANGVFELAKLNRNRGSDQMTATELETARNVLVDKAFESALQETAATALVGAGVGAAVSCVISCLEFGLTYQRGEITENQLHRNIARAVAKSAVLGGSVAGVLTAVAFAFPALVPVASPLVMPLVFFGLCAVGYKVVRLGKGWYGFIRDRSNDHSKDVLPVIIYLPNAAAAD